VLRPPIRHYRASAVMTTHAPYPIGTPGLPWGVAEVATWLSRQTVKRSYETDVLRVIETLSSRFDVVQYGHLDYHRDKYPRNDWKLTWSAGPVSRPPVGPAAKSICQLR